MADLPDQAPPQHQLLYNFRVWGGGGDSNMKQHEVAGRRKNSENVVGSRVGSAFQDARAGMYVHYFRRVGGARES